MDEQSFLGLIRVFFLSCLTALSRNSLSLLHLIGSHFGHVHDEVEDLGSNLNVEPSPLALLTTPLVTVLGLRLFVFLTALTLLLFSVLSHLSVEVRVELLLDHSLIILLLLAVLQDELLALALSLDVHGNLLLGCLLLE